MDNGNTRSCSSLLQRTFFPLLLILFAQAQLRAQTFQSFLSYISSLPSADRQSKVDSFLTVPRKYPIIEGKTTAHFVYTGDAATVTIPGDANGWVITNSPMTRVPSTNLWTYSAVFESDARLDYKFVLNGGTWILDPRNPATVSGGFGPNSELAMPDYVQPGEISFNPEVPHGSLRDTVFTSAILGVTRTIRVYTPAVYVQATQDSFPVVVFHDGLEYVSLAFAHNVLDNLIGQSRMIPVIGVFVPPANRNEEYALGSTAPFADFLLTELMPYIDRRYRTRRNPASRAMLGASFGALISSEICYNRPDAFALAGLFSPSFWPKNEAVFKQLTAGPKKPVKVYVDWGTYEGSIMDWGQVLRDSLIARGYQTRWREWHEGHSWGSWRAHLDDALEFFFPGTAVSVERVSDVPRGFHLYQNYPNPFNPRTEIRYQISEVSKVSLRIYDLLGREVVTLVNEEQPAGFYRAEWNARVSSGVYFYRLEATGNDGKMFVETKKMVLVR